MQNFIGTISGYGFNENGEVGFFYGVFKPFRFLVTILAYLLFVACGIYLIYELIYAIKDVYDNVPMSEVLHIWYLAFLTFLRVAAMTVVAP